MGALDDVFRTVAGELTGVFVDNPSTVKRKTVSYDGLTGVETTSSEEFSVKTAPPESFKFNELDGTSVLRGDMKVLVPAVNVPDAMASPKVGDFVLLPGSTDEWQVINYEEIRGGDQVAAYVLQIRK